MTKTIPFKLSRDWRAWKFHWVKQPIIFFNLSTEQFERDESMEKYGVELDPSQTKTASEGTRQHCPICGRELEKVDGVYLRKCPSHGTEPFEAKQ